jgi:hypothetical protein
MLRFTFLLLRFTFRISSSSRPSRNNVFNQNFNLNGCVHQDTVLFPKESSSEFDFPLFVGLFSASVQARSAGEFRVFVFVLLSKFHFLSHSSNFSIENIKTTVNSRRLCTKETHR